MGVEGGGKGREKRKAVSEWSDWSVICCINLLTQTGVKQTYCRGCRTGRLAHSLLLALSLSLSVSVSQPLQALTGDSGEGALSLKSRNIVSQTLGVDITPSHRRHTHTHTHTHTHPS